MDNALTLRGTCIWLICALFFMYEFILRTILGTFQPQLMQDLYLTSVQFSLLSATGYQLIYGLMQIPGGMIIDRLGLKKTLCTAATLCTLASLGFSLTHNFTLAILCRMMMGLGSSCGFICLLIAIYDWMPRKHIALLIGLSQFIGTIGPMLAAGPLNSLSALSKITWRVIFYNLSVMGAIIGILVFLFVDNNRQPRGKFIVLSRSWSLIGNLLSLMKQKQIWLIALYSASIYFSIEYLTENEGITFLVKKGFSATYSAYMLTTAWLGYAIFCPIIGFLSDKTQRRKPFLIACSLSMLLALIGIIYLPIHEHVLAICFALLGMGAGGSALGFAIMAEHCKEDLLAAGFGINNTLIVIMSAVISPLIGHLLSHFIAKTGTQLSNYQDAFTIMPMLSIIAVLIVIFYIKETYCKSACSNTILELSPPEVTTGTVS